MTKTRAKWEEELSSLDACCEPILSPDEVLNSSHFRERKMIIETKNGEPAGTKMIGVPVKLSKTPGDIRSPEVEFGESTHTVLEKMGYSDEKIKDFLAMGVV